MISTGSFLLGAACAAGLIAGLLVFARLPKEAEYRIKAILDDMDEADRRERAAQARREREQ